MIGFTDCYMFPRTEVIGPGDVCEKMFGLKSNGNSRYGWNELALRQFLSTGILLNQGPTPIGAPWCNSSTVGGRNCDKGLKAGGLVEANGMPWIQGLGGLGTHGNLRVTPILPSRNSRRITMIPQESLNMDSYLLEKQLRCGPQF